MKSKLSRLKRHVKINILVLVCSVLLLVVTPQIVKADYYQSPYFYTVTDGKATITDYLVTDAVFIDLVVPDTLGGYPVVAIGNGAFGFSSYLTSVTLPDTVTSIGDYAFQECSSLNIVDIPSSVTSIGDYVFSSCLDLDAINVDPANPNYMSIDGVLFTKDGTTLIQYPEKKDESSYEIPNTVTTIGSQSFAYCFYLTSITLPDSVTSIGDYAFDSTLLASVTIGSGVTSIGNSAFAWCDSLVSITFLGLTPPTTGTDWIANTNIGLRGHAYYGSSFPALGSPFYGLTMGDYIPEDYYYTITDGQATVTGYHGTSLDITIPSTLGGCPVIAIGDEAFYYTSLKSIIIPDGVTSIGDDAFRLCMTLVDVTIPDSVTSIGNFAFYRCYDLAYVTIPDGVTRIGDSTFYNCYDLVDVNIPDSVTSIGDSAFYGCSSLTSITIPDSVTSINNSAFYGCSSLTSITIPDSVTSINNSVFARCSSLEDFVIPNDVTSIGDSAFYGCFSLTSITIPDSVTSINNSAFYYCYSLTSITIPKSVTSIGNYAFFGCSSLTSITISKSVTSIGNSAFRECAALTSITVEKQNPNYMSIDGILFTKDGTKLIQYPLGKSETSYVIPIRVTRIGDEAFYYCKSLTSLTISENVVSIGNWAFAECDSLENLVISNSVTSIGDRAFSWCYALESLVIPNGVTSIGNEAFYYCRSLVSVTIPASVTFIGYGAFEYCLSLTNITFLGLTPPSIGTDWIAYTNPGLLGHTYYGSSFAALPGSPWWGRMMGDYLPDNEAPTIISATPSSSLITLYPQGPTASQTFSASYTDNVAVASATMTLDGDDVTSECVVDTSGFSYTATLSIGSHTIELTVKDTADSLGEQRTTVQTWIINVEDIFVPTISGLEDGQKIESGSPIVVSISDAQSGVNWDSLEVYIEKQDVTSEIIIDGNEFTIPEDLLSTGKYSIKIIISDNAGNIATAKYDIKVN